MADSSETELSGALGGLSLRQAQNIHSEGALITSIADRGIQALNNVHVASGNLQVVGGDLYVHHHHYPLESSALPSILKDVPNLRNIYIATLGRATAGTGDWIYLWEEFGIWTTPDGHIRVLWGSGMPGAGKTILASLAINAVEAHAQASTSPICVGFLYIRYSDQAKVTVRDLLEILVKQTIERHPLALPLCNEVYARHIREKTEPSTQELFSLLKRFTSELISSTFYFLDALDEAPPDVQLDLLENLTSLNAKLFITSRPLKALQARFPSAHHFPVIAQDRDLETHIGNEISRSTDLQAILATATPGLEGRITVIVKKQCGGMFLHASLQLQALRECTTRHDVEKALNDFPPHIADVYTRTWNRIINQPRSKSSLAVNVLVWVVYATRSLTPEELRHAIAINPDTSKLEPRRMAPVETLVNACCGLLVVEEETGVIRLVHYTAKAVLESLIIQVVPHPHGLLASACIGRLVDADLQHSAMDSSEGLDKALDASYLLSYSYRSWAVHVRGSLEDDAAISRASTFLQECDTFPILPHKYGKVGRFGPLHVIAFFNLPLSLAGAGYLRHINLPAGEDQSTPLHLACIAGSPLTLEELLRLPKIQVNATNARGWTPLMEASYSGFEDLVAMLLSHRHIKVNQVSNDGATALRNACSRGHTDIVKLFLAHPKTKINLPGGADGFTALLSAVFSGRIEALKLLLAHPDIDVNLADKEGNSPLTLATYRSGLYGPEMVRLLVGHPRLKLDQKHKREGWTPLQWAQAHKLKEVEEILLRQQHGVDACAPGKAQTASGGSSILPWYRISHPFGRK